jgi:hypothetical protein
VSRGRGLLLHNCHKQDQVDLKQKKGSWDLGHRHVATDRRAIGDQRRGGKTISSHPEHIIIGTCVGTRPADVSECISLYTRASMKDSTPRIGVVSNRASGQSAAILGHRHISEQGRGNHCRDYSMQGPTRRCAAHD